MHTCCTDGTASSSPKAKRTGSDVARATTSASVRPLLPLATKQYSSSLDSAMFAMRAGYHLERWAQVAQNAEDMYFMCMYVRVCRLWSINGHILGCRCLRRQCLQFLQLWMRVHNSSPATIVERQHYCSSYPCRFSSLSVQPQKMLESHSCVCSFLRSQA